jgi:hypothetical protein
MASKPPTRPPPPPKSAESLRTIGNEAHTTDDQGRVITKKEALDRALWAEALGWTEEIRDANGSRRQLAHPPNIKIAMDLKQLLDGKAAVATEVAPQGPSVAARVRALAIERLNALANKHTEKPDAERYLAEQS